MDDKQVPSNELERLQGVSSLLGIGEVECDKCGKTIKHLDRYCCNTRECSVCGVKFETMVERGGHFSQKHPGEVSRGARYCVDCGLKAGYLRMVRNKKTGEVFPAMFVSRDEELVSDDSA